MNHRLEGAKRMLDTLHQHAARSEADVHEVEAAVQLLLQELLNTLYTYEEKSALCAYSQHLTRAQPV